MNSKHWRAGTCLTLALIIGSWSGADAAAGRCREVGAVRMIGSVEQVCRPVRGVWRWVARVRNAIGCSQGDICKVGDTGAGGGIVFYVAPTPQPWGRYIEAQRQSWSWTVNTYSGDAGCFGVNIPGAAATGVGTGRTNTEAIVAAPCTSRTVASRPPALVAYLSQGAVAAPTNAPGGWFLPSKDELMLMFQQRSILEFAPADSARIHYTYASSSFIGTTGFWSQIFNNDPNPAFRFNTAGMQFQTPRQGYGYRVWPIRYGS